MAKNFGRFENEPGVYSINKLPESGAFEYIYKNKNILLKVDQFGPSFIQINPPSGNRWGIFYGRLYNYTKYVSNYFFRR